MQDTIKVHVVKYPDRDNLVMRYRDPITGRHVMRSTKTTKRDQALKTAGAWQDELRNGRYKPPSRVTWEEFREKYEGEELSKLAPNTQTKVNGILDSIEEIVNPERVRDLTSARLSYFVKKLRGKELAETTIDSYLSHLHAVLVFAIDWEHLTQLPKFPKPKGSNCDDVMKGRPVTEAEFLELLAKVKEVVGDAAAGSWDRLLRGLWLSGLRLGEALLLRWENAKGAIVADMGGRRPMLRIPKGAQKSRRSDLLPMAPEFAAFLEATPAHERHGPVFPLTYRRHGRGEAMGVQWVSAVISKIGAKAGVIVNTDTGKTASAHDLRRAFGERWAARVMPAVLQKLMRHRDINTTLKFYVTLEAEATADVLWKAVEGDQARMGTNSGTNGRSKRSHALRIA